MKKGLQKILVGGIATMMVASLGLLAGCGGAQQGGSKAGAYKDGKYEAVGTGGKEGDVPVTVTVEGGKITAIDLGENHETPAMVDKVQSDYIPRIIEAQTVEGVDGASGATLTSGAVKDGVTKALEQAKK